MLISRFSSGVRPVGIVANLDRSTQERLLVSQQCFRLALGALKLDKCEHIIWIRVNNRDAFNCILTEEVEYVLDLRTGWNVSEANAPGGPILAPGVAKYKISRVS